MSMADLHIHTTASDGLLGSYEVCQLAVKKGLAVIAITDHDTVLGLMEIEKNGRVPGLEVLPGIEISSFHDGEDVHILGFGINWGLKWLQELLFDLRTDRKERIKKIIILLNDLDYKITIEDVLGFSSGESLGRPHVAQALAAKGYFKSHREAFKALLDKGRPAYLPRKKVTPFEAVEVVHRSGGAAVLAHPGLLYNLDIIRTLKVHGLDGIEVFYPLHSGELVVSLTRYCEKNGLLATGGSDFHGFEGEEPAGWVNASVVKEILITTRNKGERKTNLRNQ